MALIIVVGTLFSHGALAKKKNITVMVYPLDGDGVLIDGFETKWWTLGPGWRSVDYFSAKWRGARVKLQISEIKTIQFIKPKKNYEAQVVFVDGKTDIFILDLHEFRGKSAYGPWKIHIDKVLKLDFSPGVESGREKSSESADQEIAEWKDFDQVLLKNGDIITGMVTTEDIQLKTSYATLNFETPKIGFIHFTGADQDIDVVILKIGDRLSGMIEIPNISMRMRSGADVDLDTKKIKSITFRK
jgi:hypothetical protein